MSAPAERRKGGELAKLAGIWCGEQTFWDWLGDSVGFVCSDAETAAKVVRTLCNVKSRSELDHDAMARARFDQNIRKPYAKYRASVGCV